MNKFLAVLKTVGMAAAGAAVGSALDVVLQRYAGTGGPITAGTLGNAAIIGAVAATKGYLIPTPYNTKPVIGAPQVK